MTTRVSVSELVEAGYSLVGSLSATFCPKGWGETVRMLAGRLEEEHERANALERAVNAPPKAPIEVAADHIADAVEQLRATISRFNERDDARILAEIEVCHGRPCIGRDADGAPLFADDQAPRPTPTAMCRCGHSSQFHHHHGIGHCGECSECEAFFEAYPEPVDPMAEYIERTR